MKLLHVITGLNVGGAETMLARLLENAHLASDIQPEVLTLMRPGIAGERIAKTGIPVHSLDMRGGVPSLPAAIRLMSLARRIRPDLIMGWMHHGQLAASLAALAAPGPVPVIWNVRHSLNGYRQEKLLTRILLRVGAWLSGTPSGIVYNSHAARSQYRDFGFRPTNDLVIPNGFNCSSFAQRAPALHALRSLFGIAGQTLLIGMIARNHPMKDVPNLLNAFRRVTEVRPDAHLLLAGDGMDEPSGDIAMLLGKLPSGSYTLAGHRTDVPAWLAGLDILALPSAWGEGFPNIVGEAMAAGIPCVATDVGDAGSVIGNTGRVVPPGDAVALGDALLDLAALSPDGRSALGKAARERMQEHYALPGVVDRYNALCRRHAGGVSPDAASTVLETAGGAW